MAWRRFKQAGKEKRERNWNVNKPYRNVNQKTEKLANRLAMQQFTHCHTAEHYYYIFYFIFILFIIEQQIFTCFLLFFARYHATMCNFTLTVSLMLRLCSVMVRSWAEHLLTLQDYFYHYSNVNKSRRFNTLYHQYKAVLKSTTKSQIIYQQNRE